MLSAAARRRRRNCAFAQFSYLTSTYKQYIVLEVIKNKLNSKTFSYSEQWRYKGSVKLRQPRKEGANLSEQSNNKRIVFFVNSPDLLRESIKKDLHKKVPGAFFS